MKAEFLFLGTGGSTGIPVIGCTCPVCRSSSPFNKRLRPSGLLRIGEKLLLIDVGPDFRQQALRAGIDHLDALLLTHTHFDHIAGIDELRIFYVRQNRPFPCLLSPESLARLQERYAYFFQPIEKGSTLSAQFTFHSLEGREGEVEFLDLPIGYCHYFQAGMRVTGFRFKEFAYITDIRTFEPSIFTFLKGVRKLVVSALREESSPLHLSLDEAIDFAQKVGAEEIFFTHISHHVDHEETEQKLPSGIHLSYDGLKIFFEI